MKSVFDDSGAPVAFRKGDDLFALDGTHLATFDGEWLINHLGKPVAHFSSGWFRDLAGDCVAFMQGASGGPQTPLTQPVPLEPAPGITPMPAVAGVAPVPPLPSVNWSQIGWAGVRKLM
jgi:hypothetical protein